MPPSPSFVWITQPPVVCPMIGSSDDGALRSADDHGHSDTAGSGMMSDDMSEPTGGTNSARGGPSPSPCGSREPLRGTLAPPPSGLAPAAAPQGLRSSNDGIGTSRSMSSLARDATLRDGGATEMRPLGLDR